jgi:transcriptional regulator with XRE-family HTH domain
MNRKKRYRRIVPLLPEEIYSSVLDVATEVKSALDYYKEKNGYTVRDIAIISSMNEKTVQSYFRGESMKLEKLAILFAALGKQLKIELVDREPTAGVKEESDEVLT